MADYNDEAECLEQYLQALDRWIEWTDEAMLEAYFHGDGRERRRAWDRQWYTRAEFLQHHGHLRWWVEAAPDEHESLLFLGEGDAAAWPAA